MLAGNAASTTPYANGGVAHNSGGLGYSMIPDATASAPPQQAGSSSDERYTGLPDLPVKTASSSAVKKDNQLESVDLVSFAHQIASGMVSV